ncbi:hypothetical protein DVH24_024980 [Malus domestica]|uniref:Uncharacterized protein n=1 Tax=Malus domestica TaxID=3750 RepID=A0A498JJS7_MALDO|nr:hypothetical protein DVH24_024980 [Malus domestica]
MFALLLPSSRSIFEFSLFIKTLRVIMSSLFRDKTMKQERACSAELLSHDNPIWFNQLLERWNGSCVMVADY